MCNISLPPGIKTEFAIKVKIFVYFLCYSFSLFHSVAASSFSFFFPFITAASPLIWLPVRLSQPVKLKGGPFILHPQILPGGSYLLSLCASVMRSSDS